MAWTHTKHEKQCIYNITLRHVHETTVAVHVSICASACMHVRGWMAVCAHMCSLTHPACKAHAPYYIVIYCLWLRHIFRHYFINGTIFRKKLLNLKHVF
jgi:hypothetical protein